MRWVLLVFAVVGMSTAWFLPSPTAFVVVLGIGMLCAVAATLAFTQARIDATTVEDPLAAARLDKALAAVREKRAREAKQMHADQPATAAALDREAE